MGQVGELGAGDCVLLKQLAALHELMKLCVQALQALLDVEKPPRGLYLPNSQSVIKSGIFIFIAN